jgi:hypothetical protein
MAMITRKTLVQRNVSAVRGGQTAWVRLGSGYHASGETPTFPISMRHSSPSSRQPNRLERRPNRVDKNDADRAALRAGRSGCFAGVLVPRRAAIRADLVSARSHGLSTRPLTAGGLSLPAGSRTGQRWEVKPVCPAQAGRTRIAATVRGRGGE